MLFLFDISAKYLIKLLKMVSSQPAFLSHANIKSLKEEMISYVKICRVVAYFDKFVNQKFQVLIER